MEHQFRMEEIEKKENLNYKSRSYSFYWFSMKIKTLIKDGTPDVLEVTSWVVMQKLNKNKLQRAKQNNKEEHEDNLKRQDRKT